MPVLISITRHLILLTQHVDQRRQQWDQFDCFSTLLFLVYSTPFTHSCLRDYEDKDRLMHLAKLFCHRKSKCNVIQFMKLQINAIFLE